MDISSSHFVGTGFLVAVKMPNSPNCYCPVVITSKHMPRDIGEEPFYVPLRLIDPDGKFSFLAGRIVGKRSRPFYISHPDFDVADIASATGTPPRGRARTRTLRESA